MMDALTISKHVAGIIRHVDEFYPSPVIDDAARVAILTAAAETYRAKMARDSALAIIHKALGV